MLTMRPKPRATIPSTAWRHRLNTLSRFTDSTASHCARSILRSVVSRVMPAALTRMSGPSPAASSASTKAPQASKSVASSSLKRTSSPSTRRRKPSMRCRSPPRSAATTRRPALASAMQMAVPSPPMPPVTTAVRLSMGNPWGSNEGAPRRAAAGRGAGPPGSGSAAALVLRAPVRVGLLADAAGEVLLQLLPHLEVALGKLVHHRPGRLPEHAPHLLAELLLLVQEQLHRALEVIADEPLHRVAVEADDLRQQLGREHRLPGRFVLGDDLQQDRAGQVFAALGVADLELLTVHDQLADVLDRDVARNLGVVQAAVGVLLDDPGRGHGDVGPKDGAAQHGAVQQGLQAAALRRSPAPRAARTAGRPAVAGLAWAGRGGGRLTSPCGARR